MAKHSRGSCLSWGSALALGAMLCASAIAEAEVGRTAGSFNVSSSGAATYSIPIFTPPGPRGMQPSVALTYSSQGGPGYVGIGWGLSGEHSSSIGRCFKTIAQDGAVGPVNLVVEDAYCLDGNRLRHQSGTYGASGSVYYTEMADFSRITASGTAGNGPASWTVERKDGTTWTYGGTSDSRVLISSTARTWLVSQIQDRAGNKILFTYKTPDGTTGGTTHPTKIEWTQTSYNSGSYLYSMEFGYASDGNALASSYSGYLASTAVRDTDLLTSISVKHSTTTVRKYVLGYDTSSTTGAKRLTNVTECSDAAEEHCLSPTTIDYQDGAVGIEGSASFSTSISSSALITSSKNDYNGDGIKDLTYLRDGAFYVRMGSPSGYGGEIATGVDYFALLTGDPFGNGRDVILGHASGTWYVYYWNGSSFSSTSTGITNFDLTLRDVDGDGRDDLVYVNYIPFSPATYMGIGVRLSTSTGSTLSFASLVETEYIPSIIPGQEYGVVFDGGGIALSDLFGGQFDANGDGREDLIVYGYFLYYDDVGEQWLWQSFEAMLAAWDDHQYYELLATDAYSIYPTSRLNSDRCGDTYFGGVVRRADCVGGGPTTSTAGAVIGATDWDADGRQDLLVNISSSTYVQRSTGEGLASAQSVSLPGSCTGAFMDANGDGLEDYVCRNGTTLYTYLHNGATVKPDLAVSFIDGFGVEHAVSYAMSTHEGYTPNSNASYPRRDVTRPQVLARTITATDGAGGTYTTTYSYFGATEDLHGRGLQGFEKIESVDSRNSVKHVRVFEREFPYTGMLIEEASYQPGNTLMSQRTVTPASTTLDATSYNQRYFPYPSASTEDVYEVGGTKNGDWITRTAVSNTFDSSGNLTASTRTVTDKDSSSPLYNYYWTQATSATISPNTTYWCLGLPTATSVAYSTNTGEASVTRSKSYTPDYVNCRIDEEVTEPSGGNRRVDATYGYDDFGNVDAVSVTGRNPNASSMSARAAAISWGTTGQFPVSETNALSQTTTRTFHSTFGSLDTETDPNGIVVVDNDYDTFGLLIRNTRADGTATVFTYVHCATYSWCTNGDASTGGGLDRTVVHIKEQNSSDAQFRETYVHRDMFDREINTDTQSISGGYSHTGRVFDAMGRVLKESQPCDYFSCSVYWVTNTYDLLGRLSTQSRPQSQSVSTPVITTFAYAGRTQTITDPQSKVTTKILDINGWLRRSQDHDGYYQGFGYDAAGSLKLVNDSLSNTLFTANYTYGIQAFQDSTSDMDLGSWSYSYNSLGELISWTDAKSQTFNQSFDALSRLTSRQDVVENVTSTWTWGTSSGSYNIGRLAGVSMSDSSYSESFTYDNKGRPSTQTITTDQAYAIDYAYTNQGLLDTLTYPTSTSSTRVKVKYGYAYGVLQSVTDWTSGSAGTVYWTANTKNSRGQTTQETLGNGVVTNRAFDAVTGWLSSIQSGVSGGTGLQNQSYLYDLIGNVTQRQENTQGLTENFYYDNLYRLDYSQLNSSTNLDLTYDAMGNITARSDVPGTGGWSYHGSKKHAVTSTGSGGYAYSYDANGNMTSRDGETISWSSYNYPTGLAKGSESTAFYYGPDRQYYRQEYSAPSVTEITHYVGGILEKVYDGTTTDWRHYIQAEGQVVAIVSRKSTSTNAVSYPLEDNQGSGSHLTSSGGSSLARQSYNAFGLPRDGSDWDGAVPGGDVTAINGISRRGYTGHSMLGAMGLIHMNGRVQDAITGRFLSPDPTIPNPGFTQSYNRYAYVNNNPLSFIDPSGFEPSTLDRLGEFQGRVDYYSNLLQACEDGEFDSDYCWLVEENLDYYTGQSLVAHAEYISELFGNYVLASAATVSGERESQEAKPQEQVLDEVVVTGTRTQGSARSYVTEGLGWALIAFDIVNTIISPTPDVGIVGAGMVTGARAARATGPLLKTTREAARLAESLGFKKVNERVGGEAVFRRGNDYITRDRTGHNGGVWKLADSVKNLARRETRSGTYDANLNRIGD